MSSVFTKASPAATSSICIVDSSDRTEKQQQQLQQCFSASSSSSSPSALSPTLPPTGNPTALSVQQHQYRTYTYYPSLPAAAKYNGPHLSIPPSTQLRSHFFHTAGAGQSPATGLALGSSPPYDSKIPSFSAQYTGQNTTSGGTGSYITSKVATTLLQLQDPVLHPLAAAPTSTYPPPPPPLKFVPGPPLQQLHSGGHEGSPTLDAPSSSASSPTQPTSYQSAAQFMFQTGHFPPSPYHHNPSPCWSHSPWPYLPFHGITGTTAAGGGGGATGITTSGEGKINSCNICGKTYARLSTLRSHLKSHSGEKPYQCSICQKSFTQAANLTAHLRTHSGEKPFKCPVCHRGFSQSSSVTTHMRTHSGDRPYKCNVCNKGFADSSTLTKHYRTHTGEKPYQCKICEARFSQSGNLNRHMRTHRHHYVNGMEITMRHI